MFENAGVFLLLQPKRVLSPGVRVCRTCARVYVCMYVCMYVCVYVCT